ncbi:thiol-activated cytolysin family protein [Rhodocytophaga aerolata]|uniref:Thiol-activated cytolysin family protein n=1 Tax=Rhodocytophaga aerolata TaxID=455078 RepID=A0ABT8RBH5_9BACT|nr:thiol-activated cytolysin family protein [Rhodocytophaga aerolata]MDO1449437.1 thiol-activated cytolysin family protein [Rhodocytophaga aerolata]
MKTVFNIIWAVSLVVFFIACKKDDQQVAPLVKETFAEIIKTGGAPEQVSEKKQVTDSLQTTETRSDGTTWRCISKKYSVEEATDDFPLFNPNASVIYPGNMLQGNTLKNASPSVIPLKRAGGTISINVFDGSELSAFTVDEVKKSTITDAANKIIGASTGMVPANFSFSAQQVQSQKQLALSLGLNVETQFVGVATSLSFRQGSEYSRFIVKLQQSFYTLSFDIPTSANDFFAPDVTPEELSQFVGPGNPATFISDVTYGRVYYMLIESSSSSQEIETAINASFNGAVNSVDLEVSGSYLENLSDLQIKVMALGGASQSTISTIGKADIGELVELLGESTDIASGVPVSYVVRSALTREVVSVKLATEYEVKTCLPLSTPLGKPILFYDASDLDTRNTQFNEGKFCTDCLATDGKTRYFQPTDAISLDSDDWTERGTVVKKWQDLSDNKFHASAVAGDPMSRPMFIPGAFNNGRPAVEFYRGNTGRINEDIYHRLTYSGGVFANTDYTVFAVVAYPERVKLERKEANGWQTIVNEPNRYGYFMMGTNDENLKQLMIGFQNNQIFRFSHKTEQVYTENGTFAPSAAFSVMALRFSQTEGMSIYQNGVLIAKDPTKTRPLVSNEGAMLCAGSPTVNPSYTRVRIGEIVAYGMAATDAQIAEQTRVLNAKYGL